MVKTLVTLTLNYHSAYSLCHSKLLLFNSKMYVVTSFVSLNLLIHLVSFMIEFN